jgi:hypothetical protein
MQGQHGHLSAEQKQLAFRLRARGWHLIDISLAMSMAPTSMPAHLACSRRLALTPVSGSAACREPSCDVLSAGTLDVLRGARRWIAGGFLGRLLSCQ